MADTNDTAGFSFGVEWRPLPGRGGTHEVSNAGGVRRLAHVVMRRNGAPQTIHAATLKTFLRNGYPCVELGNARVNRDVRYVHRLVAEAFIGPLAAGAQVDHINFTRTDNRAENLRIVSQQENIAHTVAHGRHKGGFAHWAPFGAK